MRQMKHEKDSEAHQVSHPSRPSDLALLLRSKHNTQLRRVHNDYRSSVRRRDTRQRAALLRCRSSSTPTRRRCPVSSIQARPALSTALIVRWPMASVTRASWLSFAPGRPCDRILISFHFIFFQCRSSHEWANLGQGAPEVGDIPDAAPRPTSVTLPVDVRAHAAVTWLNANTCLWNRVLNTHRPRA